MYTSAYPEFDKEMYEKRYSLRRLLADETDLKYPAIAIQLRTGKGLKVEDALKLKKALKSKRSLEKLFEKVG